MASNSQSSCLFLLSTPAHLSHHTVDPWLLQVYSSKETTIEEKLCILRVYLVFILCCECLIHLSYNTAQLPLQTNLKFSLHHFN
jgi:hypothetical protein